MALKTRLTQDEVDELEFALNDYRTALQMLRKQLTGWDAEYADRVLKEHKDAVKNLMERSA